jgi:hypothetical protein
MKWHQTQISATAMATAMATAAGAHAKIIDMQK